MLEKQKVIGVIPARYGSSRVPGKIIANIAGKPMIQWGYIQANKYQLLDDLIVALTEQSVFYLGGSVTQFNFDNLNFSKWERLRSDCWRSTISAEGMILSPEAGGAGSRGNWLETSMVMAPISRAPITIKSLGETSIRDYKQESWGDYVAECAFNEFVSSVEIELLVKPGTEGELFYTTDGSEPDKNSQKYTMPFSIDKSCEVKAAIFLNKGRKERKFVRGQEFVKVEVL